MSLFEQAQTPEAGAGSLSPTRTPASGAPAGTAAVPHGVEGGAPPGLPDRRSPAVPAAGHVKVLRDEQDRHERMLKNGSVGPAPAFLRMTQATADACRAGADALERLAEGEAQAAALRRELERLAYVPLRFGPGLTWVEGCRDLTCRRLRGDGHTALCQIGRALRGDAGRALLEELEALRRVVDVARDVGDEDLDETDVAERLADAIDACDKLRARVGEGR